MCGVCGCETGSSAFTWCCTGTVGCGGDAYLSVLTDRFTVPEVIGRTVVIHSDPDDFSSQPSGHAGARIGCGVIRAF